MLLFFRGRYSLSASYLHQLHPGHSRISDTTDTGTSIFDISRNCANIEGVRFMNNWWKALSIAGAAILAYEASIHISETAERHSTYRMAREYCDSVNKPLLRIGVRRGILEPPMGDVTLDIDPIIESFPGGVLGDERSMPFSNKQFGACFNENTLEHLEEPEDVELAVNECVRVADMTVLLAPSPYGIYATLFCPTHNLRLWFEGDKIRVAKNKYITGIGFHAPAIGNGIIISDSVLSKNIESQRSVAVGQQIILTDTAIPVEVVEG
jgi:hypothetical protein